MMFEVSPQLLGVIVGVMVFIATIFITFLLLVFGGSFKRMRDQASIYHEVGPSALKRELKPRPELYDELLEAARTLPKVPAPPRELCGRVVTLRTLREGTDDAAELWEACSGLPTLGKAFDPELELWNMTPYGPFKNAEEFASSPILQPLSDGVRFKVVDSESAKVIGMAAILANEPSCLRAEIGDIWLNPAYKETHALREVHYLLLEYLFGLGYRRVESRADAGDPDARISLPASGFLMEGVLRKHMIVKGSNRDTVVFAMLNSDWRDKARVTLEKFLDTEIGPSSKIVQAKAKMRRNVVAAATATATAGAATRVSASASSPAATVSSTETFTEKELRDGQTTVPDKGQAIPEIKDKNA